MKVATRSTHTQQPWITNSNVVVAEWFSALRDVVWDYLRKISSFTFKSSVARHSLFVKIVEKKFIKTVKILKLIIALRP